MNESTALKQQERTVKALHFITKAVLDHQGHRLTQADVKEILGEVHRLQTGGDGWQDTEYICRKCGIRQNKNCGDPGF